MRTRGNDNIWTEQDVCLVIDHTNERALLIGGRGEAESTVDMLLDVGSELEEFNYRNSKQYYKPLLHRGNTMECGLGLPVVKYDTVVIWPNKARVDIRVCKPGVHKETDAPTRTATRLSAKEELTENGEHLPQWYKDKWKKPFSGKSPKYRYNPSKKEWIEE